jgi:transcriptional regulator with XRE-family HTH domain
MGRVMRVARWQAGLKAAAVAFDLSISPAALSYYETGKNLPSFATLIRFAKLTNVTPGTLLDAACMLLSQPDMTAGDALSAVKNTSIPLPTPVESVPSAPHILIGAPAPALRASTSDTKA